MPTTTLPANPKLFETNGTFIGNNKHNGQTNPVYLSDQDRARHIYTIGKTGTGKSVFLSNMIRQDMASGKGLCLMEPHGNLIDDILPLVPENRLDDVILFDPSDIFSPLGLNVLNCPKEDKEFVSSQVTSILIKLFSISANQKSNPRIELFLQSAIEVAMSLPEPTFEEIIKIVDDEEYRNQLVANISHDFVRHYFSKPIDQNLSQEDRQEVTYMMHKLKRLIENQMIANVINQQNPKFNLSEAVESNKIILVNLSKGRLGYDESLFLGMLFQLKLFTSRFNQLNKPQEGYQQFYLYLDEAHSYSSMSLAILLAESRQFKFSITLTNQFLGQVSKEEEMAIFGNTGTLVVFQTGVFDAEFLVREFEPLITTTDITDQPNYHAYVKTILHNEPIAPFSLDTTLSAQEMADYNELKKNGQQRVKKIKETSRSKYSKAINNGLK